MPPRIPLPALRIRGSLYHARPFLEQPPHRLHSTLNQEEISHFDSLAQTWWDPHGESRMLHLMNPARVRLILDHLAPSLVEGSEPLQGKRILDVGCGGGVLSESLARLGATVQGLDGSPMAIKVAKGHARRSPELMDGRLDYVNSTTEKLVLEKPTKQYSVVTAMEILEHVDNPSLFLSHLTSLLAPNGYLFLSTISRTPLSYLLTIFAAEHLLRMVPVGTHSWKKYINPEELRGWFEAREEMEVVEVRGVIYVPWEGKWRTMQPGEKWAEGCNYFLVARKKGAAEPQVEVQV
ncbi:Hexaprenyldihydroxybenzoate methyltransferase, mitochondrial [Saitoella coloradoensis]